MSHTHTFLLTRIIKIMSIDAASIATMTTLEALSSVEAWARFRDAVTEWIIDTEPGREAWEDSVADFNIGDANMSGMATDREFRKIAGRHGISQLVIQPLSWDLYRSFDEVLANAGKVEEAIEKRNQEQP